MVVSSHLRYAVANDSETGRGSTRTRSGRAGSVDSVKAPAMTNASGSGSLSMKESSSTNSNPSSSGPTTGFEVTRKFLLSVACPLTLQTNKLHPYSLYRSTTNICFTVFNTTSESNDITNIFE